MNLIDDVVDVATVTRERLLSVWSPDARPADRRQLIEMRTRNEAAANSGLREALAALPPDAGFIEDDLPDGEVGDSLAQRPPAHRLGQAGRSRAATWTRSGRTRRSWSA